MEIGEVYFIFAKKRLIVLKSLQNMGYIFPPLKMSLPRLLACPDYSAGGVYCSASLPVSFLHDERPNKAAKKFNKVYPPVFDAGTPKFTIQKALPTFFAHLLGKDFL